MTKRNEVEQLRAELARAHAEIDELRAALHTRPPTEPTTIRLGFEDTMSSPPIREGDDTTEPAVTFGELYG
jgi:hypothetical protein